MAPLPIYGDKPVVLLTNDDGPPCSSSPNIYAFYKTLVAKLGWEVKVVIPDCQKSWVGKAYAISDIISASYFYPLEPDGLTGETSTTPRPLKEGETMEWILLTGTPATCTNIALHNLYPGQIDLVISGPNHGRNSSTAFSLSSGTLGAALAGALSPPLPGPFPSIPSLHPDHIPCIAVSYGVVTRPVTAATNQHAADISADICSRLWQDWGYERGGEGDKRKRVQVYSINVPLVEDALTLANRKICWTKMWRNTYGQLFKTTKLDPALNWWANASKPNQPSTMTSFVAALSTSLQSVKEDDVLKLNQDPQANLHTPTFSSETTYDPGDKPNQPVKTQPPRISTTATAGPGAIPTPNPASPAIPTPADAEHSKQLKFHFAPTMAPLLFPSIESLPEGTDGWAFAKGWVSVTPIRAEYGGMGEGGCGFGSIEGGGQPGEIWT
ncbi:hypothetical protein P7C73_g4002, partial [Tremellales sp. Uapishka_1]